MSIKRFFLANIQGLHALRRIELSFISRFLSPQKGETILDIGCGKGFYSSYLHRKGAVVTGVDPGSKQIEFAKEMQPSEIKFILSTGEKLPFEKNSFDKAVSVCVLEHTQDDKKVLSEVHRVLKKGGTFAFSVDTINSPHYPQHFKDHYVKEYHVNQMYTREKITSLLEHAGFDVVKTVYLFDDAVAAAMMQFGSAFHFRSVFFLLFPIIYPILLLDLWINPPKNSGLIMVIHATKK